MNFKTSKLSDSGGDLSQRWYVYYFFKDPETGKLIRFTEWISSRLITRGQRYEKAKEIRKRIDLKLNQGWNPFVNQNRGLTTISQSIEYFLTTKSRSVRYRTLISYRSHLKPFQKWLIKMKYDNRSIESFTYYLANDFMDWISSHSKVSNRTWNNYLQTLRHFFTFLLEKEYITVNPFLKIHYLQTEQTELIAFTRDELNIISNKLPSYNHDLYVIALLIFNCFLRPQEIVRLRIRHLKYATNIISIPGAVSKNKKSEVISILPQVRDELQKLNMNFPDDYFVFGPGLKRSPRQTAPTRISENWRSFADLHGIKKNIYALKHTGNGMALIAGANARDLQLQNRHSSLEETQKYLERFSRIPSDQFIENFPKL
jgi:integrase